MHCTCAHARLLTVLVLLGMSCSIAEFVNAANRGEARVFNRYGPVAVERVPVDPDRPDGPQIIRRRVVEPAAVVSRALSEQPVLPHLVEVQIGGVTVLIDPEVDYRRETGGLDENHTIRQAQRLYRASQARPARVLRHPDAEAPRPSSDGPPVPDAIFYRLPAPPAAEQEPLIVQAE